MRTGRAFLLSAALLLFSFSISRAIELEISSVGFQEDGIDAELAVKDSLPSDLVKYMEKGVPIIFSYELELWKSRTGWIDKRVGRIEAIRKVRYDTWEKEYSIVTDFPEITIENRLDDDREALELLKTVGLEIAIDDTAGEFYLVGKLTIKLLSLSNLKEVESWLRGELSGAKKPKIKDAPDKVGEFIFNTALKVSGLKDISDETRSPMFEINGGKIVFQNSE